MTWRSFEASVYLRSTDIPIGDGAHAQSLDGTLRTRHGHLDSGEGDNHRGLKFLTFQFSRTSGSALAAVNHQVTRPAPQTAGEGAGKKPEVPPSLRSGPENGIYEVVIKSNANSSSRTGRITGDNLVLSVAQNAL